MAKRAKKTGKLSMKDRNANLLAAAKAGNYVDMQKWIKKGANINAVDEDATGVLHFLCKDKRTEMVQYCIDLGANVNICSDKNGTIHAQCFISNV